MFDIYICLVKALVNIRGGEERKKPLAKFGGCVHYMPIDIAKTHMNKLAARWRDGIFLGLRDSSNEYFVGTREGVFKTRSIQLKPESQKHEVELLKAISGTPWQMVPGREATLRRHSCSRCRL